MRSLTILLLILIQDSGGRGQEVEGRVQEDIGRGQGGEARRQEGDEKREEDVRNRQKAEGGTRTSVVIEIEEIVRQPYNCTAFLDTLEVRKYCWTQQTWLAAFDTVLRL